MYITFRIRRRFSPDVCTTSSNNANSRSPLVYFGRDEAFMRALCTNQTNDHVAKRYSGLGGCRKRLRWEP